MSKQRESHPGTESLVDQVMSEQRERMTIRSDFAEEIARNAITAPRTGSRSRVGVPAFVIVVASVLTASTAIAGIVHLIRQAPFRTAAPPVTSCVECEPLTPITPAESNSRAAARGTATAVPNRASPPVRQGAGAQAARLAITREIRIDGVTENLVAPRWILVGRDGRIAIDQQQDRNVRLFDVSGRPIGRFGRRGEGPGEFENTYYGGWVGDSLWLHDISQQRTTVITPDLAFARVIPDAGVKPQPGQEARFPTSASSDRRAMYEDGTSLVAVLFFSATPAGFDTIGFRIFRVAGDGAIRNQVIHLNQPNGEVRVLAGGRFLRRATPFYARPLSRVSDRGNRIAILSCIYDGQQARTMRVVMLGASGDTVYARNYPFTPETIPRTVADSAHRAAVANTRDMGGVLGAADAEVLTRAVQDQMRIPPFYPPFTSIVIADDGTAWIELRSPAGGATSFMLLDPRGSVTGTVTVPARTKVLAASATHMWGIELNQDDVPSVVRYRVAGR